MTIELIDLRAKITELTDVVLEAQQRISGKERSEIVRDVLHEWASCREREATLLRSLMESKGISGNRRD